MRDVLQALDRGETVTILDRSREKLLTPVAGGKTGPNYRMCPLMSGSCDKGGSMIFDTDVPICFLRGDSRAARLSGIRLVPVSESMSDVSLSLIEAYAPGKVLGVSDALIAATARDVAQPLATGNARHFKVIAGLEVKVFRPGAA